MKLDRQIVDDFLGGSTDLIAGFFRDRAGESACSACRMCRQGKSEIGRLPNRLPGWHSSFPLQ